MHTRAAVGMLDQQRTADGLSSLAKAPQAGPLAYRATNPVVANAQLAITDFDDDLLRACVLARGGSWGRRMGG